MTAEVHTPNQVRVLAVATPESSTSSCVRRTSRSKVPRVVPPLLQGRDGSGRPAPGPDSGDERPVVRRLSFTSGGERETGLKRKAAASPSSSDDGDSGSGGASRDSRGTEVSSASVFRASGSQVDRASVVLVTRNLRLRCDSLATGSDLSASPSGPLLADDDRQPSGATPCSASRCGMVVTPPGDGTLTAQRAEGGALEPPTPAAAAQLSFSDWAAALQRSSGISNPLARPPLPLSPPGAAAMREAFLCEPVSPVAQRFGSRLSALDTMLQFVTAAEHRARTAAATTGTQ
jgi:hypothetical protein